MTMFTQNGKSAFQQLAERKAVLEATRNELAAVKAAHRAESELAKALEETLDCLEASTEDSDWIDQKYRAREALDECGMHHVTPNPDSESDESGLAKALEAAKIVVRSWELLSKCENEFGAKSSACGEYEDWLDRRIIELRDILARYAEKEDSHATH